MPLDATKSDLFSAIAEPRRREIIELLARDGELAVGALVLALGIPQPAVSKHLAILREVNIVAVTRRGRTRLYRLNPEELKPVHAWIHAFERLWTHQLTSIKALAEARATQNHQTHPNGASPLASIVPFPPTSTPPELTP